MDISYNQNFMDDLFDVMTNDTEPMRRRQNVVFYVHQLCTMAKKTRVDIYKRGIEILQMALDTNPNFIRSHIARRSSTNNSKVSFDTIISQSLTVTDVSIMPQLTVSIRTLLDIKSELRNEDDKDNEDLPSERTVAKRLPDLTPEDEIFLNDFYKQFLSSLATPLLLLTKATTALDQVTYARCESTSSLLSSAVRIHPERIKDLLASSRVSEKLCLLFKNDSKYLRLMALNFFRVCLKRMEKCFNQLLVRNKSSMNVLNTACLDFFGFIRKVLDMQDGHDAEADEKAFKALIASRLKEILPTHLRPLFKETRQKLKVTDLEETSHSGSHAHKKQRTQVSWE
ncbi:MAG: hypothetical protein J3R72DRAFT_516576 [Linnemannia gamsii]|nr:MAG: hypothetical protein J3R72DRAFT_516576 [Linnemannia gamsii]